MFVENEIDGDAFRLLDRESLKAMITKQGLLLKFEQKFKELSNSLDTAVTKDSTEHVVVIDDVKDYPVPGLSSKPSKKPLSDEIVKEQSKIYGRFKSNAKLNEWQEAVNAAAFKIAPKSPNKMYDRASLKTKVEAEARKSFVYKKKTGSRSKFVESVDKSNKQPRQSTDDRTKDISLVSLELQSLTSQSANKQKEIAQANDLHDYERCGKLHKELRALLVERQKAQNKLTDLQRRQAKHLNYMARKATSSKASATTTATSSSTATASKVDIGSFLKVRGTRDKNHDSGDDSGKPASKKRRLNLKDPSDKNIDSECIEVGGKNANEETNSYEIAKVSGEKKASSMRDEEEVKDDQKSREDAIEASDDKTASSMMVEEEVKDDRKSTEERIEASGDKAASSIMVEEEEKDGKNSSEEETEASGGKNEPKERQRASEKILDVTGVKAAQGYSASLSVKGVDDYFL